MKRIAGPAAAILLIWTGPALGQSCGSPSTNGGLAFGAYSGALLSSANSGLVTCTSGVGYDITAGAGSTSGGTVTSRKMAGPSGATLSYLLTRNAAHTLNWGVTTGSNTIRATGNGAAQTYAFYGAIPASQTLTPGSYSDTVAIRAVPQSGSVGSASLLIQTSIPASCTLSATSLNFGAVSGAVTNLTSTVTARCTNTTAYTIGLNAGAGAGASVTSRKMTGPGGATLAYSLFRDGARTLNWGNTAGVSTLAGTGNGGAQVLTVYGQLPAQATPGPGTYSDTIVATVTY